MENQEKFKKTKSTEERLENFKQAFEQSQGRPMTPIEEESFKDECRGMGLEGEQKDQEQTPEEVLIKLFGFAENESVVTLTLLRKDGELENVPNIIIEKIDEDQNKIYVTHKGVNGIVKSIDLELSSIVRVNE
jgi:hypothetical protein